MSKQGPKGNFRGSDLVLEAHVGLGYGGRVRIHLPGLRTLELQECSNIAQSLLLMRFVLAHTEGRHPKRMVIYYKLAPRPRSVATFSYLF